MTHRPDFTYSGITYFLDKFEENKECKITINGKIRIKIFIESTIRDSSELEYLDSLKAIIKYQIYSDRPRIPKYKEASKLIMDSKETDVRRIPRKKRKKYSGALAILLLNAIDSYLNIDDYDYIITAPIYFKNNPPDNNDIMEYRENYLLSVTAMVYNKRAIHHVIKKKVNKKMKDFRTYAEKKNFAEKNFIVYNRPNGFENKNILIIDDVTTTGITGEVISKILKEELNVRKVDMIAVAKTLESN